MKQLITIALVLSSIFASTFLIIKLTGILTVADIEAALDAASKINPLYVAACVAAFLFADLFIAVPTLTICIFSGYFLGFMLGGISATIGMLTAGICGYTICWRYGSALLKKIYKKPAKLREMKAIFFHHGSVVLLMCRALPILPEVSCCLAGANRMPFIKFIVCYSFATIPYAFIAAMAGSHSSLNNPLPAIFTAIAVSLVLWSAWLIFLRKSYGKRALDS